MKQEEKIKVYEVISTFEMYDKEESGRKPNTVRIITFAKEQKLKEATHIRIRKGYTKEFFTRKITDKTKWKNDWIISWNPNNKAITNIAENQKRFSNFALCKALKEIDEEWDNQNNDIEYDKGLEKAKQIIKKNMEDEAHSNK